MKRILPCGDPSPFTCYDLKRTAHSLRKQLSHSKPTILNHILSLYYMMKEDLDFLSKRRNVVTSYPPTTTTYSYSPFGSWWSNRKRKPSRCCDYAYRKAPRPSRSWTGMTMAITLTLSFLSTFYSSLLLRNHVLSGNGGGLPTATPSAPKIRYLTDARSLTRRNSYMLLQTKTMNTSSSSDRNQSKQDRPRTFPKWGSSIEEENTVGLSLDPFFDFLFSSSAYVTPMEELQKKKHQHIDTNTSSSTGPFYRPIVDYAWTETLYMIEPGGTLWTSQTHRAVQNIAHKPKAERRFNNTERLMLQALDILKHDHSQKSCTNSLWPTLCRTIFPTSSESGQGLPFLTWYGDYDGCDHHNWVSSTTGEAVSVPLFTVAARVDCNYTIPFPNYYSHLMTAAAEWDRLFALYRQRYPWALKTAVVAWRGGMTGVIPNATAQCPRWRMVHAAQAIDAQRDGSPPLFDVAINNVPPRARPFTKAIEADLGPIHKKEDTLDFLDFQKYRAILDIDGNSWSGRFGSLLCFNSVILKVEPTFVDYFYYEYDNPQAPDDYMAHTLQPWKHYIPVKADFSDLEAQAAWALDPVHDTAVQEIVRNANDWCRRTMLEDRFARDMLNVWERYVQLLYVHDPVWNRVAWPREKPKIQAPFDMVELTMRDYPTHNNVVEMFPVVAAGATSPGR